jgi:hypothetical protein
MSTLPVPTSPEPRLLTAAAFQGLADVPPEMEWFANLGNKATRRAYETALKDFMRFTRACHRLARRARPPRVVGNDHSAPTLGARVLV